MYNRKVGRAKNLPAPLYSSMHVHVCMQLVGLRTCLSHLTTTPHLYMMKLQTDQLNRNAGTNIP